MTNPDIVFETDPHHGLMARNGWEKEEARTVLHDLGWEWQEELHALVPPADTPDLDAGVQAVEQLHLHGYRTGYAVGPYGAMRLTPDRAEQVFTKAAARETSEPRAETTAHAIPRETTKRRHAAYSEAAIPVDAAPPETLASPSF
ncbi:hypothetical protein [Streptomyces sp. CBMA123]|uniref:hypothetical protein n=1 Tax=Streptomyces sp. CBMA123 TaxID=1896313 RepID=UPI0016619285|nr:hypothetical protein [Streptomyces sp. CBMA123]